ncbi:MAG: NAD(P)H-hydrate dehydratase [Terriglobia bacterium]
MIKILTASDMQRIDRLTTERYGVPSLTLMENAGAGVVKFLANRFRSLEEHQVAIFCGRGNNGGDGFVVGRLLRERGLSPRTLLFGRPDSLKGDAAINYKKLEPSGVVEVIPDADAWNRVKPSLSGISLIVDALLGTGLSKPLQGFLLDVVRDVNSAFPGAFRVAVDLPSGCFADTGELAGEYLHADACITFTAAKRAHIFPPACEKIGEWRVHEIGTPPEVLESDPELFLDLVCREDLAWLGAPRPMDGHKGLYGHVLVLAGSVGKTGAAAMAAKSALRAGAGLVTVATPRSALPLVAVLGIELMTEPLPETENGALSLGGLEEGRLDQLVHGKSILAIGPGLGSSPETAELVRRVVNRYALPVVLDADGLNAFTGKMDEMQTAGRVRVLTPHPGEMARLTGSSTVEIQKRRIDVAREFAKRYQVCLVLKGARSLVASRDGRVSVNPTGNPGMATAGTGDCLTGLIAGLLAQYPRRPLREVVAAAVYLHGLAGDLAARKRGETSMIAGDLLEAIPEALVSVHSSACAADE